MSNTAIKKLLNTYISESLEGYGEYILNKYEEEEAELIIKALKKLDKKLNQKINQDELMRRISSLIKPKAKKASTKAKKCKDDEILNPASNRCVKKNGAIGKKLLAKK